MLKMPLARYFFFVGAALLALLFVADAYLPKLPVEAGTVRDARADLPMMRIHSDRRLPDRVVFDTRIPMATPVQTAAAVPAKAPATKTASVADVSTKVREAFAQLQPPDSKQLQPSVPKTPAPAPRRKHKIAKRHQAPPMVLVAQQRPFGFFNTW